MHVELKQDQRCSVHRADHSRLPSPYVLQHTALHLNYLGHATYFSATAEEDEVNTVIHDFPSLCTYNNNVIFCVLFLQIGTL